MNLIDRAKSEYAYLTGAIRALRRVTPIAKDKNRTICDAMDELADRFADKPALIDANRTLTFREYNALANRYARWALSKGIQKGDCVALMMPNCAEYPALWLGIARAGGVTACLNTNLTTAPLAHCIDIVEPKIIIVAASLFEQFQTAESRFKDSAEVWVHGEGPAGFPRVDTAVAEFDDANIVSPERPALTISDRCLYIYTSGTTGLPKAANINHFRVQSIMNGFSAATAATEDDRIYVCLPLYHTAGGVLAVGTTITVGGSVVIAERFSASQFWDDIVDNDCTLFQYIGELCRYLLNSPPHPKETRHRIRLCSGNGLRPDIWMDFKERYAIPQILEWYAATEGNAVLFNFDGKPGAIGRIPRWAKRRFVIEVIEYDTDTGEPIRDGDGFCKMAAPDTVGEMISQILDDPSKPSQRFDGYADKGETEKKILRDAFEKGDAWFRTGDLVRKDELGYFYFVDRIGDTFRWKGENVATSEVSEAITVFPGVQEANVYGVEVEGHDGRAGMAALVVGEEFDIDGFHDHVARSLPRYARPLMLRLSSHLDVTGTFKLRKIDLVKEGFNPGLISDRLYFDHQDEKRYVPLDRSVYDEIQSGRIHI